MFFRIAHNLTGKWNLANARKKIFIKVYRTVQELGIQVFTEQSSGKFKELFRIKCKTFRKSY